jgi:hypothetical protein
MIRFCVVMKTAPSQIVGVGGCPSTGSARVAAAVVCIGLLAAAVTGVAQRASAPPPPTPSAAATETTTRIVALAQALLALLDDAGRARVQFPFDGPQKEHWSNFPTPTFIRQGLRVGDLTGKRRAAVMALLATALSPTGYQRAVEIMGGDEVLRKTLGRGERGAQFGEDEYYLAFVGTPSVTTPWMLQFGGHHLGLNLTIAGGHSTATPSHTGAQPAIYTLEGRVVRPLGRETDKAFGLVNDMTEAQRRQAIIAATVSDLVLGPGQDGRMIQPEGVRASTLSEAQQTLLLDIVREWAGMVNDAFAEPRMAEIRSRLPETYFAWSGPTSPPGAGYFRIQGPTLVIEYSPQGSPDHTHTIYRDPTNDYGATFVRR